MATNGKKVISSILLVLTVVILIAISALIVGSVLGAEVFSGASGTNVDSLVVTNVTATDFGILSSSPHSTCVLNEVKNGSTVLASGNYTLPSSCSIIASDSSGYIGDTWSVNYTYTDPGSAGLVISISELTTGFSGFMSGIIGFLAVIGIIVGVFWLMFYIRPLFSKEEGITNLDAN